MAANAFRHLFSRWTATGVMSKAAAKLPQGQPSWVPSARRHIFGFDEEARAAAKRHLDHDTYMELLAQEGSILDRACRRIIGGMYVAAIEIFFVNIVESLPPRKPTTGNTTSEGV